MLRPGEYHRVAYAEAIDSREIPRVKVIATAACIIGMTIFRICLLDAVGRTTEVRWVSARTRKAALAIARNMLHAPKVFGFELWRERRRILVERRKARPTSRRRTAHRRQPS